MYQSWAFTNVGRKKKRLKIETIRKYLERHLAILIYCLLFAEAELLVPNYDNVERQLKVYEIRDPLVLSCDVSDPSITDLTW